ncbi:uncharacterized [Tachysurus ichikawai]
MLKRSAQLIVRLIFYVHLKSCLCQNHNGSLSLITTSVSLKQLASCCCYWQSMAVAVSLCYFRPSATPEIGAATDITPSQACTGFRH